jgi:hypothetical protein
MVDVTSKSINGNRHVNLLNWREIKPMKDKREGCNLRIEGPWKASDGVNLWGNLFVKFECIVVSNGWSVNREWAWDVIDCMTIFPIKVMGVGPMNLGKVKASLILTWRNSNSFARRETSWLVITIGDMPVVKVMEGIDIVSGSCALGDKM